MTFRSLFELFDHVSDRQAHEPAYRVKRDGRWVDVSRAENRERVTDLARGLLASGLETGERVGVLSQTRLEWMQADCAVVLIGSATVGIYPSNLAEDCAYIIDHAELRFLFVEDEGQRDKIRTVRAELPRLETVIVFEGEADPSRGEITLDELISRASGVSPERIRDLGAALSEDDLAAVVYTSGTTGTPKGVMLTHGNLLFTTWSAGECMAIREGHTTLVFLPLAHVYARMIVWLCLRKGIVVAFAESIPKVADNLREVRPDFITSVPRVFEKIHERILAGVDQAPALRRRVFAWALDVGSRASRSEQNDEPVSGWLRLQRSVAESLVFSKIQDAFGGRMIFAISGAAPLNPEIARFFHACGVLILEGIGMTENTSFSNVNRIADNKFGTVGPCGPGIEMRTADDGEVLYRGANVMAGYLKDAAATAETIRDGGWLHTGDIGEIDADGFLRITDRKKDLIVTAGGKNVAPQRIERTLRASKYLSQVVAYGDKRKFISALVTLEREHVEAWAAERGVSGDPTEDPRVQELVHAEIERGNERLASFETVKKFRILPRDLSIEEGELTPTLKVKRKVVYEKFAALLNEMYGEGGVTKP